MIDLETKTSHETSPYWKNSLLRRGDGEGLEKIQRRHVQDTEMLLGSDLRRVAETAAKDTEPVVEDVKGIDAIVVDPENPHSYTYFSFHPDFVDCYYVVADEELGAKANVAKRAPYDTLSVTLPKESDFLVSVRSESDFSGKYSEPDAEEAATLGMFDTCREAANEAEVDDTGVSRRKRGFGAAIARLRH